MNVMDTKQIIREVSSINDWHIYINALYKAYYAMPSKATPVVWQVYEFLGETVHLKTNYEALNKLLKANVNFSNEFHDFIKKLVSIGVIEKRVSSVTYMCPVCGSLMLMIALFCPYCGSRNVYPSVLAQHIRCGYTAPLAEFKENSNKCPYCGLETDKDLLLLGKTFVCENCRRTFRTPNIKVECMNKASLQHKGKDYVFDLIDLNYRYLYNYHISDKYDELMSSGLLLLAAISHYISINKLGEELQYDKLTSDMQMPIEIKKTRFDLAIQLVNGNIVLFDYGRGEMLPYTLKRVLLERTNLAYYVLSHNEAFLEQLGFPEVNLSTRPVPRIGKINMNSMEISDIASILSSL
jgi:predicted RNA-binding Zn-ribbon protein involved in translation (DUF1610 family)